MRHRSAQTRASSLTAAAVLAGALAGFGIQSSADAGFTLDVRLSASQGTGVTVSGSTATLGSGFNNGGTVNLDVYGLVTGTGAAAEGLNDAFFGVGSVKGATNATAGNLSPVSLQPIWLGTATAGTGTVNTGFSGSQYTNAQGNLDVGSTNSAAPDGWVFARATTMQTGNSFFLGTLTYTVTAKGADNSTTTINAIPRAASAGIFPAVWQEDGLEVDGAAATTAGVTITVAPSVVINPADFNSDTHVNFDDFTILVNNYGATSGATHATGDANGDTKVDFNDFTVLVNNYGTEPTGIAFAPALAAVPEPTSLGLIGLGAAGLIRRKRK